MSSENAAPPAADLPRVSYAQSMEDILLDRVFGRESTGTYMDIGANHPTLESNTYFFYLRGWRGVNLEPIRRNHELFLQQRPRDLNLAVAASEADGELTFHEIANAEGLTGHSTLSDEVADHHRSQGFAVVDYTVPVRTVRGLVEEFAIAPPDFLSIDVECHEGAVLRGIPWESWRPKALVIESLLPLLHRHSHESWEPSLLANGYLFAAFNGVNRFYLRDDLRDKLECFLTPVNVLDHYQIAELVETRAQLAQLQDWNRQLEPQLRQTQADRDWDRANFEVIRRGWEWGIKQSEEAKQAGDLAKQAYESAREAWEREFASFERDRANFEQALGDFQRERAAWQADREWLVSVRDDWERRALNAVSERDHLSRELAAAQTVLRPYRLIDRLGVVSASYGAARRFKRKLVS